MANKDHILGPLSELEIREAFHCTLLAHLPTTYCAPTVGEAALRLKGGVNLRLFHESPRHSEDMDFDLSPKRGPRFIEQLRKLLKDRGTFRGHLLKLGIQDLEVSEIDEGTSGFKQKLRISAGGVSYPTKIEASYREETPSAEARIDVLPARIRSRYRLPDHTRVAAYGGPTALWQKTLALSRRTMPQTRDAYDLHHLMTQPSYTEVVAAGRELISLRMNATQLSAAAATVLAFTPGEFRDQTAVYLPRELRANAIAKWPDMQHHVWAWLVEINETLGRPAQSQPGETDAEF